jgi:Protein of unknown function (DUF2892).
MECNLSNWERGIRIGIGVGLLSVGLFAGLTGWQAAMADCLGAIAVFTDAAGFCPVWNLLSLAGDRVSDERYANVCAVPFLVENHEMTRDCNSGNYRATGNRLSFCGISRHCKQAPNRYALCWSPLYSTPLSILKDSVRVFHQRNWPVMLLEDCYRWVEP